MPAILATLAGNIIGKFSDMLSGVITFVVALLKEMWRFWPKVLGILVFVRVFSYFVDYLQLFFYTGFMSLRYVL